jgi:hypothetical protein
MTIEDVQFERIEAKIADVQRKIDKGLFESGTNGAQAIAGLREARAEVFKLQSIIKEVVNIEPTPAPNAPEVA